MHHRRRGRGDRCRPVVPSDDRAPRAAGAVHPEGRGRGQVGDTVLLAAGTYRQSVDIKKSGITLRGDAAGRTVLRPAAKAGTSACAKAGNGVCVTGTDKKPLKNVSVRHLTVRGYAKNGVWATATDNLKVRHVIAEKNGQWGIAQERSVRGVLSHNVTRKNGDAGLFVANTVDTEEGARDAKKTVIRYNKTAENRVGVTVRRLRNLSVDHNEATGNCAAVFVVGDESKPRAGHLSVSWNNIHGNNKYCAKTPRLPFLQGSGIVLTGVEETRVAFNRVENNKGTSRCPAASCCSRASSARPASATTSATTW